MTNLELLNSLFKDESDGVYEKQSLGHTHFPTGKIIAAEPFLGGAESLNIFEINVPSGNYAVSAFSEDDELQFLLIAFSDEKPVRWETEEYFGPVETGAFILIDEENIGKTEDNKKFESAVQDNMDEEYALLSIVEEDDKKHIVMIVEQEQFTNFLPCVGYDKNGNICALVIDCITANSEDFEDDEDDDSDD